MNEADRPIQKSKLRCWVCSSEEQVRNEGGDSASFKERRAMREQRAERHMVGVSIDMLMLL